jgi:hypothetical protein
MNDAIAEKILAELAAIRLLLEQRAARPLDARHADLVAVIRETVGDAAFNAAELVQFAETVRTVADALVGAGVGLNARKVGRFLRKVEGVNFGGFVIVRRGEDRDGIVWRLVGLPVPKTRAVVA